MWPLLRARSGVLRPHAVTSVVLTGVTRHGINIINRSGAGALWYRLDGGTPTVAGHNSHPVLGSVGVRHVANPYGPACKILVVKLVADEPIAWTVEAEPYWVARGGGDRWRRT